MNGPTIFTDAGARSTIARGLPFGPGGGVLRGIDVSVAQGGPMVRPDVAHWRSGVLLVSPDHGAGR